LPDRTLVTLRDAADYITALPSNEAAAPEWQAAIEATAKGRRNRDPVVAATQREWTSAS
jgi:hypothetical protein